jgi:outer membrane protein
MTKNSWIKLLIAGCSITSFHINAENQYYDFGFVGVDGKYGQSVFSDESKGSFELVPDIFYNGEYGFVDGGLVNVSVLPYVGISGQWRFSEVSDDIPDGINDRDGNGELGITLGTVGARLTYLQDITNEHNGYELQLHLGYTFDTLLQDFTLTPFAEVDYRDKRLSQHLYGISATEAANSGLNSFEADSSFVYKTGLIGIYSLTPDWLGLAKVNFEHHDSDSPIIQRDLGWSVSLGITYKFTH